MTATEKKKRSGGKRTAPSTSSKSNTRKKSSSSAGKSVAQSTARRPIRREVMGVVCLLLALCVMMGLFSKEGLLTNALPRLLRGLFGVGYFATVPALVVAAWILLDHRGRPVLLRTQCTLVQPYLFGVLCHLLFSRMEFPTMEGFVSRLWTAGEILEGGGVLSGATAQLLLVILGRPFAVMLLLCMTIIMLLVTFDLSVSKLVQMWEERERLDYDEDDYEEPRKPVLKPLSIQKTVEKPVQKTVQQRPVKKSVPTRRPQIDIPIDIPLDAPSPITPPPDSFLQPRSKMTPAELLEQEIAAIESISQLEEAVEPMPEAVEELPILPIPEPIVTPPIQAQTEVSPMVATPVAQPTVPSSTPSAEDKRSDARQTAEELEQATAQVTAEIENSLATDGLYHFPPVTLLDQNVQDNYIEAGAELNTNARRLADTLRSFGVDATAGDVVRGPAITRYEFVLDQGVKLSKVKNLADDIALALGASGVRIAPIPEKNSVVGIEVPNKTVSSVLIRDVIESQEFMQQRSAVSFALGRDIGNHNIVGDIAKLPHVLIAGTTGSGKSVCTNSLIISLLYKSSPDDVRFIMVDPKMVELAPYNGIPHLLIPVVTEPKKAAGALQWAVYEMMKRYKTFSEVGVKKLEEYNALARQREDLPHMASVVVVIDELADLMLVAAKEVEESICRVAQMGRAAGMHLVIATQRPSADVITGLMKANIPSRIAFAVASSLESRIILDNTGAENLVGRGDMLYAPLGSGKPQRVQGCFITPEEIERVVSYVKSTGEAQYSDEVIQKIEESVQERDKKGGTLQGGASAVSRENDGVDELFDAAVDVILETRQASASMLQRRLKLGYSRAARLVDQMEERGIVGPSEGSKPRQLLISKERWQEMKLGTREAEAPPVTNYTDHVIPWEEQE